MDLNQVAQLVALAIRLSARYDVNVRNGVPFCPRCNRQVSYRRGHCRACGHGYRTWGPTAAERAVAARAAEEKRQARRAAVEARARRRRERAEFLRSKGFRAGPIGEAAYLTDRSVVWYSRLGGLGQAICLGLLIASPAVVPFLVYLAVKSFRRPR